MSNTGTIINKPVNFTADVATLLPASSGDEGILCKHNNVNKWAFHKPVRYDTLGELTDEMRASVNCGLAPVVLTKMLAKSAGMASSAYTKTECLAQIAEWTYNKPRGRVYNGVTYNEWFRILDFDGYKKDAIAPDGYWLGSALSTSDLEDMRDCVLTISGSGYNFSFTAEKAGGQNYRPFYQTFSMRIGTGTNEQWSGGGDSSKMDIPISLIAPIIAPSLSTNALWRIALAVWIPDPGKTLSEDTYGAWYYFICRHTLYDYHSGSLAIADVFPDFASNPYLASRLRGLVPNNGYAEFTMVPVLIKNIGYEYINQLFCPKVSSTDTEIYCMPSGTGALELGCGTPPTPQYWEITSESISGGAVNWYLKNTDTVSSHTFNYQVWVNGSLAVSGVQTISANTRIQIYRTVDQAVGQVIVTAQDGEPV